MVAIYITLGLLFLFSDMAIDTFPAYRTTLGCVLLGYGCLRAFLSLKKIRQQKDDWS